jgi:hypothetical protein
VTADLYPRPDRDAIAARVHGQLPGAPPAPAPAKPEAPDYVANFGANLRARLRVLGLAHTELAKRAGMSGGAASRAINGHGVHLGMAAKIAVITGGDLITMLGTYSCGTCGGQPPPGYACLECGTQKRPAAPGDRLAAATAERTGRTG